jgi:hypothetical protein
MSILHTTSATGGDSAGLIGQTQWNQDHTVTDLVFSGILDGSVQTHAASHTTTTPITITAAAIEVSTDGDGDLDYLYLPAGTSGQQLTVYIKSNGAVADSLQINATFADGSSFYSFGTGCKGKGVTLIYSTTATAGWIVAAVNGKTDNSVFNYATAAQALGTGAGRTYITGSRLTAPSTGFKIGTILRWTIEVEKTNASTATSTLDINFGTASSTADTARISWTSAAQTAAVAKAIFTLTATIRGPISATCVVAASMQCLTTLTQTTGFSYPFITYVASAAFDITTAGIGAGVCLTEGAAAVWTVNSCVAEAINT